VCVVGSGTRFVSGISYYTYFLSRSLSTRASTVAILMRALIPRRLYPGHARVGSAITDLDIGAVLPTFNGVDWFGFPSMPRALAFLRRNQPRAVVFQWWSGSVLPWYLLLARSARRMGADIIIEFHEDLDTGEAKLPVVGSLVSRGLRNLVAGAHAYVVHSEWDRERLVDSLGLDRARVTVIPHGPYPMASALASRTCADVSAVERRDIDAGTTSTTVLFFGTIRPYKGLEHLVEAFNLLPRENGQNWRLVVVGETWEGWTLPLHLIAESSYRDDIEVINRYVTDDEVPTFFAAADVVALPYLRSSASGPLHLTMSLGLPVVVTSVGGLVEAASGYSGATLVPPSDPVALAEGLVRACGSASVTHSQPIDWSDVADLYEALLANLQATRAPSANRLPTVGSGNHADQRQVAVAP
jgi:glycosyltransferase involved in cell wall biosynthesis